MRSRLRPKLNYANVIASIALFVALSGVAVAANLPRNSVGPNQIKRGAVNTAKLKKNAVTPAKLRRQSVVAGKLGANAVLPGNIVNGGVTTAKIANGAVRASSIANNVITTNKLNNNAVTTAKLAPNSVGTGNLVNGSVTLGKLAADVSPLLGALRSGQTLRGVFALGGTASAAADPLAFDSISYQFPIAGSPPAVNVLKTGTTNANCAGIGSGSAPTAIAGHVCVYLTEELNLDETTPVEPANNQRLGFGLVAKAKEAGPFRAYGQWAVTAP